MQREGTVIFRQEEGFAAGEQDRGYGRGLCALLELEQLGEEVGTDATDTWRENSSLASIGNGLKLKPVAYSND